MGTEEKRDGYAAQGSYYVSLPDGRLQKVSYTVNGDGGYVADVTYEGEAQYPPVKASCPPLPPTSLLSRNLHRACKLDVVEQLKKKIGLNISGSDAYLTYLFAKISILKIN